MKSPIWLLCLVLLKSFSLVGQGLPPPQLATDFNFTEHSFATFTQKYLPAAPRRRAQARPQAFLRLVAALLQQEGTEPYLSLLVDKQQALPKNYVPDDLLSLEKYPQLHLTRKGLQLRQLVLTDLLAMTAAAAAAGVILPIASAYRSFAYQGELFGNYARRHGIEAANRFSARAGESQHQLGLALDFAPIGQSFAATAAGRWLAKHALDYGFSLSYPRGKEALSTYIYEPWHYRYVGRGSAIAALLVQYFGASQPEFYLFWQAAAAVLKRHYRGLTTN